MTKLSLEVQRMMYLANTNMQFITFSESDEWPCGCNQWWILAFVAFMIGAVGIAAIAYTKSGDYTPKYTVSLDFVVGLTQCFGKTCQE
jgi:hypothetical protein